MGDLHRLLDHPVIRLLVIGTFSVGSSYLFWMIGGNFAKVVSNDPAVGMSFELGGAIAGFASVFLMLLWAFKELHKLQPLRSIKVHLIPRDRFSAREEYSCKVRIYDRELGNEQTFDLIPRREAGYLTIDLRDLRNTAMFRIELRNSQNIWQSEYYGVAVSSAEMEPL
jgi:hypothetical protein